jgi:MOSC domain-containing protein YiiM
MKLQHTQPDRTPAQESLAACLATVLEIDPQQLPGLDPDEDPSAIGLVSRWLGGLGLGMARVAEPATFSWAGPWIARVTPPGSKAAQSAPSPHCTRFVVMYGVPSGVVWDPAGDGQVENEWIVDGYLLAAADIALARPPLPAAPVAIGQVEQIWVAPSAGVPARALDVARAMPGRGLEGDRYVAGAGTFPSGPPGSALTLIEAEVCDTFDPVLGPDDHRRNIVTRGVALNDLLGHEFALGEVRCRGMRLCEPCTVIQRYAGRAVLRELVHRGGLRADILSDGEIRVGDEVRALGV